MAFTFRLVLLANEPNTNKITELKHWGNLEYNQVKELYLDCYRQAEEGHDKGDFVLNCMTNHSITFSDATSGTQYHIYYNNEQKPYRDKSPIKPRDYDFLSLIRRKIRKGKQTAKNKERRYGISQCVAC